MTPVAVSGAVVLCRKLLRRFARSRKLSPRIVKTWLWFWRSSRSRMVVAMTAPYSLMVRFDLIIIAPFS